MIDKSESMTIAAASGVHFKSPQSNTASHQRLLPQRRTNRQTIVIWEYPIPPIAYGSEFFRIRVWSCDGAKVREIAFMDHLCHGVIEATFAVINIISETTATKSAFDWVFVLDDPLL